MLYNRIMQTTKKKWVIKDPPHITRIELPDKTISVGPGTVPLSSASVQTTSIKDMTSGLRKASKSGLFDSVILPKINGSS